MTGREKIARALSPQGTPEFPVVIPYEGIFIRDHWDELTALPWWTQFDLDLEQQVAWRSDVIRTTDMDWFYLPSFPSRDERDGVIIEERADGVFRVNKKTGHEHRLTRPEIGGWPAPGSAVQAQEQHLPSTKEEIAGLIHEAPPFDSQAADRSGRNDLARLLLAGPARDLYPIVQVNSPLWCCYGLWGFEGMMMMLLDQPELVHYACERYLTWVRRGVEEAAWLGAQGIWIEECMTDMISPETFRDFNLPYLKQTVNAIRKAGMKSIYYYCGSPEGKWDLILDAGADALSLEEGKKGFEINIEDAALRVNGRCTLLGNLDAIGVLEQGGDEDLWNEIQRQKNAGRRNSNRFIMCLGSPVTPGTPVTRVKRYGEMTRRDDKDIRNP